MPLGGGTVIFPLVVVPIVVTQERSRRLIDDVMGRDRMLVVVSPRPGAPEQPGRDDLHEIGTVAVIHQMMRATDGSLRLLLQGLERVRLGDFVTTEPYLAARIEPLPDQAPIGVEAEGLRRAVIDLFRRLVSLAEGLP